jgi:hypothetical protein
MPLIHKAANFIRGHARRLNGSFQKRRYLAKHPGPEPDIPRADWTQSLSSPTQFYLRCLRFFEKSPALPEELRSHRAYFTRAKRGFGEDAFHVMWFLLFREFKPTTFLEIGVYRGQTLSLAALLQRRLKISGEVVGISPFESIGDSVSKYGKTVDYLADTRNNFSHFDLPSPALLKAFSTDEAAIELIESRGWDCIYIDGNHDYEIVRQDWKACSASVRPGGIIVLDDAGLSTTFAPPVFATKGHPGPSRIAAEIDRSQYQEVLQVGHNRVFQKLPTE